MRRAPIDAHRCHGGAQCIENGFFCRVAHRREDGCQRAIGEHAHRSDPVERLNHWVAR